jgi:hypothetical protein
MFNRHIRPSLHESQVAYQVDKPLYKHEKRLDRYFPMRLAGEIWWETEISRKKELKRTNLRIASMQDPVGLGFGVGDNFGPDESYNSLESLSSTLDQYY